ncbi:Uncharacterised protein [Mycobacterium tuberculosis]|nr:Uncharacterised protein [Mycobacterium tuberculosis]
MDLVIQRSLGHQVPARLQYPHRAEPHRHRLAVVVRLADNAGAQRRRTQSRDDRRHQHEVHHLVVDGGSHEHRPAGAPPVDQQGNAGQGGDAGDRPQHDGLHVICALAQTGGLSPRLRDHEPDTVADDDHQDAEMKHRAGDPQQPRLVQLGRAGGPAEFVIAVAPPGADRDDRHRHIRHDGPEEFAHHVTRPAYRGHRVCVWQCGLGQGIAQRGDGHPVPAQQPSPRLGVDGRGEFEHHRQEVRGLAARWCDVGAAVGLGEGQHLPAAVAGVAGGPVGQVQGGAASQVEGVDVAGRRGQRIGTAQLRDRAPQQIRGRTVDVGQQFLCGAELP